MFPNTQEIDTAVQFIKGYTSERKSYANRREMKTLQETRQIFGALSGFLLTHQNENTLNFITDIINIYVKLLSKQTLDSTEDALLKEYGVDVKTMKEWQASQLKVFFERTEVDLNVQDRAGKTALMRAVEKDNEFAVHTLIALEVNVNIQSTSNKDTAITLALGSQYPNAVKIAQALLLVPTIDLKQRHLTTLKRLGIVLALTVLGRAMIESQSREILKILLNRHIQSFNINNELRSAIRNMWCGQENFKLLLSQPGIDLKAYDEFGETPFTQIAQNNAPNVFIDCLLEANADLNGKNRNGNTPLMTAVTDENLSKIRHLVKKPGHDLTVTNNKGQTVFDLANGDTEILAILNEIQTTQAKQTTDSGNKVVAFSVAGAAASSAQSSTSSEQRVAPAMAAAATSATAAAVTASVRPGPNQ